MDLSGIFSFLPENWLKRLWHEGWKAVTFHQRGEDFDQDHWELYHLDRDLAEINDLAGDHPQKLEDLIDLWWDEAQRYGLYFPVLVNLNVISISNLVE